VTLQFLFTDGDSFFHDERRNFTSEIDCITEAALGFEETSREMRTKGGTRFTKRSSETHIRIASSVTSGLKRRLSSMADECWREVEIALSGTRQKRPHCLCRLFSSIQLPASGRLLFSCFQVGMPMRTRVGF
jgi:hypothetical protein